MDYRVWVALQSTRFIPLAGTLQKNWDGTLTHTPKSSDFVPPSIFKGGTQKVGRTHTQNSASKYGPEIKVFRQRIFFEQR